MADRIVIVESCLCTREAIEAEAARWIAMAMETPGERLDIFAHCDEHVERLSAELRRYDGTNGRLKT